MTEYSPGRSFALFLDEKDPMKHFRQKFLLPKPPNGGQAVYLSGNSLGAQPKKVLAYIQDELQRWADLGALGHTDQQNPWMLYHKRSSKQLAALTGADPSEVIAMNSLTINLHLLLVSFYRPTSQRYKIVVNPYLFPSDSFAIQSQLSFHGLDPNTAIIEVPPDEKGNISIKAIEDILNKEGSSIALLLLEGVNYYTGQALDIKKITQLAHKHGCIMGFDLAHTIGNMELALHDSGVDFAVWCSYKYLNGGPGGVGGCFVHKNHHDEIDLPRLAGWFGHSGPNPFISGAKFSPRPSIEGWQLSNPPIIQLAALQASLDIFSETAFPNLRQKSILLTGYLEYLIASLENRELTILTPSEPEERGCQISISLLKGAKELTEKMRMAGLICDFRPPGVIRLAPAPLYNTFLDAYIVYEFLKDAWGK